MKTQRNNQEIVLAAHPIGVPTKATFGFNDIEMPVINREEVLLKSLFISVDPGMRGFMDKGEDDAAGLKFELNKPITSRAVAQVIESNNDDFPIGTIVHGRLASIAVQLAKFHECRVVGIAGSDHKIDYLEKELGIDKGINYKKVSEMNKAIGEACPNGVDVFFDNVGGELFDAAFENINRHARIVICGQIADYNETHPPKGPRPQHALIRKSARMEGFVVFDFKDEFEDAKKQLGEWYRRGKLKYRENVIVGFENIPSAFIGLFSGENMGKQLVKVAEAE